MEVHASSTLPGGREQVRSMVEDLETYPLWLSFVLAAVPAPAGEGESGPAWWVDLGARLGPLSRSKRVRIVRTKASAGEAVFTRSELDGRHHSPWVLTLRLTGVSSADGEKQPVETRMDGHLYYGGNRLVPGLDRLVARELRLAGSRLSELLRQGR